MIMNDLKKLRLELNITQIEAAKLLNISRKTYQNYESLNVNNDKLDYFVYKLKEITKEDENNGIVPMDKIIKSVNNILKKYDVKSCYLFGSYAKNKAKENSDIDLLIDSDITGLDYYGLIEELRETLHKKIDLLTLKSISDNSTLLYEILKDGIKIYG